MTMLTWCEVCGDDMHEVGGKECDKCGKEMCFRCLREHKRYCGKDDDDE